MSAISLKEPFEIEQKIITIEKQNNLFDISVSIPVEINSKPKINVENSKILNENDHKINGEAINGENDESMESDTEKSSISEHDPEQEEKILITCKGSGISLVSGDGRHLRNWEIPSQYSVITPAKCLIKSARCYVYVIIHSENDVAGTDKVVWFWKDKKNTSEGLQVTKKKVKEFEREIFSLELSSLLPNNVILINKDGSLLPVKSNLKPACDLFKPKKKKSDKGEKSVIWTTLFNSSGSCVPTNFTPQPSLIVLTISMNKPKHLFLSFIWIKCDTLYCGSLGQCTLANQLTPLTFNFDPLTGRLFVLFSSGVLKMFIVTFNFIESKVDISLSEKWKIGFNGMIPFTEKCISTLKGEHAIGIAPISDSFLALVGMQKTSVSINKILTIWDLRYGTLQAERILGTSKQGSTADVISPSLFKFQLIVVPGSNLIVSTLSESLQDNSNTFKLSTFLCRYNYEPMTLLHALNRMKDSSSYLQLGNGNTRGIGITRFGILSDEDESTSDEFLNKLKNNIKNLQREESKFLKFLFFQPHTAEEINERFKRFVKKKGMKAFESFLERYDINREQYKQHAGCWREQYKQHAGYWKHNKKLSKSEENTTSKSYKNYDSDNSDNDDNSHQKLQDLWKTWEVDNDESRKCILNREKVWEYLESREKQRPELSYYFVQTVVEYCLSKNPDGTSNLNCWVPGIFQYLIQSKMISNNIVKGGIIKALIEREAWGLIKSALYFMNDIPEDDLVYLLKRIISSQKLPIKIFSIESTLRYLIAAPKNDNMMMLSLRQLTEDEVIIIMKILSDWTEKYDETEFIREVWSKQEPKLKKPDSSKVHNNLPEFHKLLEFLTLLFDVHFTTMIMNPKIHPLLTRLAGRIAFDVSIHESLQSMRGCLELYHDKYLKRNSLKKLENVKRGKLLSYMKDTDLPEYSVELFTFYGD